ncbi:MAG: two-component system, OmpR family, sensor kinase, partial [Gaiellales bacterium]|nr:two-component system, OmpR family, sensor kinase [Gaiellales bacterium]
MRRLWAGLHTRLLMTALLSVALALAVLVTAFNLLLSQRLDANAADQARARATAELAALDTSSGTVKLGEAADAGVGDSPIWVFAGNRPIEEPRTSPPLNDDARALADSDRSSQVVSALDVRLEAVPVVRNGRRIGTVIAGVSLKPYDNAKRVALVASVLLSVLLLAVVGFVTRRLLKQALQPVSRMAASARAWSAHELDRRFDLGPPTDELSELAATLDALLTRIADTLRREQRLTAEISHELRTPLARVATEAELALRRDRTESEYRTALAAVERNAREMTRIIDALLDAARAEAGVRSGAADPNAVARRVVEACGDLARARGVDVALLESSSGERLNIDDELATRTLQPIVENACRYARSKVTVTVTAQAGQAIFAVLDDGDGVTPDERTVIFEPGARGVAGAGS